MASHVKATHDVDIVVRNQRFSQDTFFFDIFLQNKNTDGLFLSNSDFVLDFESSLFTNPNFHYQWGTTQLTNVYGNPTLFYDSNINTFYVTSGLNANRLQIVVRMPMYTDQNSFYTRIARIDNQVLKHKLGTFYITGLNTLNKNPEIRWRVSGKGLVLNVNHRDSSTLVKSDAICSSIDPVIETPPSLQASNLKVNRFSSNSSSLNLSWTRGDGNASILFVQEGAPITEVPENGIMYLPNNEYGLGNRIGISSTFAAYLGTDTTVTVSGLQNGTRYYFALFELNGANGYNESYLANPDTLSAVPEEPYLVVSIKTYLQGAYHAGNDSMNNHLRMGNAFGNTNLLPPLQPYNTAPWNYTGTEYVDTALHPTDAVDWILVELRSTYNGNAVSGGQAAGFILRDGNIVDTSGSNPIRLFNIPPGYYYVVVKHRNHLPIMSRDSILLNDLVNHYDFTQSQSMAYGTDTSSFIQTPMAEIASGVFGMKGGDMAGTNYTIRYNGVGNDRVPLLQYIGGLVNQNNPTINTYQRYDINLDRSILYNGLDSDRSILLDWLGGSSNQAQIIKTQVPNP